MMKKVTFSVDYQKNYRYVFSEPVGKNFDSDFKPELTPKQMLEIGVFGGVYFSDKPSDLPKSWFKGAKLSPDGERHKDLNFFAVNASQPLEVWKRKKRTHPQDPRGWFQWYCRYYLGRRS